MISRCKKNVAQLLLVLLVGHCNAGAASSNAWVCQGSVYAAPFYYMEVVNIDFQTQLWDSRWMFGCSQQEASELFEMQVNRCLESYLEAIRQNTPLPIHNAVEETSGNVNINIDFETYQTYHPVRKISEDSVYIRFEIIKPDGSATAPQILQKNVAAGSLSARYIQTFGQPSYRPNFHCDLVYR